MSGSGPSRHLLREHKSGRYRSDRGHWPNLRARTLAQRNNRVRATMRLPHCFARGVNALRRARSPCRRPPFYFAWGCFRVFGWKASRWARLVGAEISRQLVGVELDPALACEKAANMQKMELRRRNGRNGVGAVHEAIGHLAERIIVGCNKNVAADARAAVEIDLRVAQLELVAREIGGDRCDCCSQAVPGDEDGGNGLWLQRVDRMQCSQSGTSRSQIQSQRASRPRPRRGVRATAGTSLLRRFPALHHRTWQIAMTHLAT
jgi:hypothetical protein